MQNAIGVTFVMMGLLYTQLRSADAQAQNTHTFTFLTLHVISLSSTIYIQNLLASNSLQIQCWNLLLHDGNMFYSHQLLALKAPLGQIWWKLSIAICHFVFFLSKFVKFIFIRYIFGVPVFLLVHTVNPELDFYFLLWSLSNDIQ